MSILGQSDLPAAPTKTSVATVPTGGATVNILLCNRSGNSVNATVWLVPNGTSTPANQHLIEATTPIDPYQILERGGIPLVAGDQIFVMPSATGVSCTVVAALGS